MSANGLGGRRHRRAAMVMAGVLAMSLLPALVEVPSAAVSASIGAPNVGNQQPNLPWENHAQMLADLDAVQAAGMTWVRTDFYWPLMEPQRGQFSWGAMDEFVRAASARGLRVLATPDYTPVWARSGPTDHYPPTNNADYAAFVAAAARRYAPMGVHAWEIWNEPNRASFWLPKADPPTYTHLLQVSYAAIEQADAHATVISGGLSPAGDNGHDMAPQTFLDAMYRDGARGSFDAVGYHAYSWPYPPMYVATWNTFYETPNVHAIMTHYGDGSKLIWGTETGYATGTGPEAVTEAQQAQYTVDAIRQWESWSFHGPFFLYTIRDMSSNPKGWNENMGMLTNGGSPKPVYTAVREYLTGLATPSVVPGVGTRAAPASGTATLSVPVTLDRASSSPVTVAYSTASSPPAVGARPGIDYVARSGTVTFAPGQTRSAVAVTIRARSGPVAHDAFFVRFHDPTNARLGGYFGLGLGVITAGAGSPGAGNEPSGGARVVEAGYRPGAGSGGSIFGSSTSSSAAALGAVCGVAHRAVPDHRIARPHPPAGTACALDLSTRQAPPA